MGLFAFLLLLYLPTQSIASELQIHQLGLVIHGIPNSGLTPLGMKRKLDDNGRMVFTPGLAVAYKDNQNNLYSASVLKDCYDHYASTFLVGKEFETKFTNLTWSISGGFYLREEPALCLQGECFVAHDLPLKVGFHVGNNKLQILPIGFVGLHYKIEISKDSFIHLNGYSNFFLSQFTVGYGFRF